MCQTSASKFSTEWRLFFSKNSIELIVFAKSKAAFFRTKNRSIEKNCLFLD